MKQKDFFKVYRHGVEYTGTALVMKGSKKCPNCSGRMVKIPVNQPFIDKGNGYYPVSVSQVTGKMVLYVGEVETIWVCKHCPK